MQTLAALLRVAGIIALFAGASLFAQTHAEELRALIGGGPMSMTLYVFLVIMFVVFVIPLDLAILLPPAVVVWGPVPTALLSIIGWTLGSGIAFFLARRFGPFLLAHIIPLSIAHEMQARIPERNVFYIVVLLRMSVPVDILSYALGLFSTLSWRPYMLATLIGVSPFAFVFSYGGALPPVYQILVLVCAFAAAGLMLWSLKRAGVFTRT